MQINVLLGQVCRQARKHAGLTLLDISQAAGVSEVTVSRFERGTGWRRETDEIVEAYARLLGVDPAALWRQALDLGDA